MKSIYIIFFILFFMPITALAHCPLCTAGAGVLAGVASYLGISTIVVGVLVGAFSLALGLWLAGLVRRRFIPYQYPVLVGVVFLLTVLPIAPLIREYRPLYLSMVGEYGTLMHNTYAVNLFLLGSAVGALLLWSAPYMSKALSQMIGRKLPYQGLGITFGVLIGVSLLFQFVV